jgi:3-vinyl bacteriochlorophyllide hydratase
MDQARAQGFPEQMFEELKSLKMKYAELERRHSEEKRNARREKMASAIGHLYTEGRLTDGVMPEQELISYCEGLEFGTLEFSEGETAATISIVIKTILLYTIMSTGCIWEKVVFGRYLFAQSFFWEDVFSMLVLALHTAYLFALFSGSLSVKEQMLLALAAYATYIINAIQFLLKLRAARLQSQSQGESDNQNVKPQGVIA